MSAPVPTIEQIKHGMRSMWMAGDFGVLAKRTAADAEAFVDRVGIAPGKRVLDVACGTGNVAIPLARRGAIVTGVDIAPNLLAQARERAAAEDLNASFDDGDAEQLPYADEAFDAVVSMFGAMFAPRPALVVSEAARVLKPGGLLAMANWNPVSFTGRMFKVMAQHVPPPPGLEPPVLWGDEATVCSRLTARFEDIRVETIPISFDMPTNPAGAVAMFREYFGPTQVAFSRLNEEEQASLAADLEALWAGANLALDPLTHTLIKNEYLLVTAIRRAF